MVKEEYQFRGITKPVLCCYCRQSDLLPCELCMMLCAFLIMVVADGRAVTSKFRNVRFKATECYDYLEFL